MRFRGRKKDVIVSASGLNIYPDDLEAALLRQAQVQAVAVIEVEGPKGGEPMAALVMRGAGDAAEAVRAANAELAEFQQIRRWVIWPEPDLPRGPTGKILHRMVAAAIRSSAREHTVTPASAGTLAGLIAKITGEDAAAAADSARLHGGDAARLSEDLHLDSLGRVELQSSIETRFGIALDDAEYQGIKTLGELKQMVQRPTEAWSGEEPGAVEGASHARREEHIYPEWPWSWHARAVRFAFQEAIMRPLVWLLANPRVVSEPITNVDKPLLIVANHVTTFDVPLILYALRHLRGRVRGRVAVAMAAGMLLDWRKGRNQGNAFFNFVAPFQYWLVTALFNVFPLPRTGNFRSSFAHAGRAMDRGYHVLVFPEGERTPDGKMHAFLGGSGLLWKELRAEALPVYLGGVGELKVNRSNWFRSGKIWVRAGKAMEPPETGDPAEMTKRLEEAVRGLGERGGEESR
jgi:long-chain acyl-CoA synthetase